MPFCTELVRIFVPSPDVVVLNSGMLVPSSHAFLYGTHVHFCTGIGSRGTDFGYAGTRRRWQRWKSSARAPNTSRSSTLDPRP
eukprot:2831222-Rhodomonas_salina.1